MARHRSCKRCNPLSSKAKFYKSLRSYIITLIAIFTAACFIDNDIFDLFRLVALWWGIALSIHFMKLRGIPGTNGWLSDDWFDWIQSRYPASEGSVKTNRSGDIDGEDYDPLWKDKDLV